MFESPFTGKVGFAALSLDSGISYDLQPEESSLVPAETSGNRKEQFRLGRAAAHLALKQIGFLDPPAVLRGKNREPLWPEGVSGSITHSGHWAIAAVVRHEFAAGIGIDLQSLAVPEKMDIALRICTPKEMVHIAQSVEKRRERLLVIFSAKESCFKAFAPIADKFLGFHDVELLWKDEKQEFQGELLIDLSSAYRAHSRFSVGVRLQDNFVFTWVLLPL